MLNPEAAPVNASSQHTTGGGMDTLPSPIGTWTRAQKKDGRGAYKFHYKWNFDDGNSGFLVQKKSLDSFKLLLDSNQNGKLDKKDVLIFGGTFMDGYQDIALGRHLGRSETGTITAKVFSPEDHGDSSMDASGGIGINSLGYQHLSFLNAAGGQVLHEHGQHYLDSMGMG
jgi:hypothetical protein